MSAGKIRPRGGFKLAQGARDPKNRFPRVAIAFDEDMFARLQALAADRKISFGEAVRHYCALGLKTKPAIPVHVEEEA
jgi:hypothetical protein